MINVKTIPEIEHVFETDISPYAVEVQRSTIEWAKKLHLLDDPEMLKKYEKQSIGYLASRAHPYDSFSDAKLTSDYLLLICILDDYSDHVTDSIEFKHYTDEIITILKNSNKSAVKDSFQLGWKHWWARIRAGTPLEWQHRIIETLSKCFDSITWEITYRIKNQVPNVDDYIRNRQHSGSVFVCFDLIERGGFRFVPTEARGDLFNNAVHSASKIANWMNDILSLQKEIKDGDIHNLVLCVQEHNQVSVQEALDLATRMIDDELIRYKELKNDILSVNTPYQEEIENYLYYMELGVRGNYEWSKRTKRF
ncbi:terpene synthase family protein [Salibacterium halotolerans]|uniref:Terpene synthase n=1 Tax=Salibacterium halotolerans TaxID=1884432 RepID=A0A1I5Y1G8_9BACI|nr:terpene synthase family protein [Salibacterium halotolerans]SFQ38033.1 Terpene synthase family, metal binding domain [Salibacterium halotolerans]